MYHCPLKYHSDGFFDFAGAYDPIQMPPGALKAAITAYGVMAAPGVHVSFDGDGVWETNAKLVHNHTDDPVTVRDEADHTYRIPPYGAVVVTEDRHRIREEEEDEFGFDEMEDLMEEDNDPDDHPDDLLEGDDLPFN